MSEAKKGRVICSWCKGDMGEAETELDTHGCCLKCLKLALQEMDERLSAFAQGQEGRLLIRSGEMARVKALGAFWQEAVATSGRGHKSWDGVIEEVARPKFEGIPDIPLNQLAGDWRWYVPDILQEHWGELRLETRLGLLVMAESWAAATSLT